MYMYTWVVLCCCSLKLYVLVHFKANNFKTRNVKLKSETGCFKKKNKPQNPLGVGGSSETRVIFFKTENVSKWIMPLGKTIFGNLVFASSPESFQTSFSILKEERLRGRNQGYQRAFPRTAPNSVGRSCKILY